MTTIIKLFSTFSDRNAGFSRRIFEMLDESVSHVGGR